MKNTETDSQANIPTCMFRCLGREVEMKTLPFFSFFLRIKCDSKLHYGNIKSLSESYTVDLNLFIQMCAPQHAHTEFIQAYHVMLPIGKQILTPAHCLFFRPIPRGAFSHLT